MIWRFSIERSSVYRIGSEPLPVVSDDFLMTPRIVRTSSRGTEAREQGTQLSVGERVRLVELPARDVSEILR